MQSGAIYELTEDEDGNYTFTSTGNIKYTVTITEKTEETEAE